MKTSFILPLLLLIQLSLIPYNVSARSIKIAKTAEPAAPLQNKSESPSAETFVSKEPQELEIVPGVTKRLTLQLKGDSEEITFEFSANEIDPSLFVTSVFNNGKLINAYNYQALKPETLSTNFEYQTGLAFVIIGNNGFSLTTQIPEDQNYHMNVTQERIVPLEEDKAQVFVALNEQGASNMLVVSATAGACGLLMLAAKAGLKAKRKRNTGSDDLIRLCQENNKLPKKLEDAVLFNSQRLRTKDCTEEGKQGSQEYVGTLLETSILRADVEAAKLQNRGSLTSLATTAATFTTLADSHQQSAISNNSQPLTLKRIHDEIKARSKPFAEDKAHYGIELTLEMDFEEEHDHCQSQRRAPTTQEIKTLVRKMHEEGTIGYDCDPSAESNDEDQYEAPHLPNYVCCMLCFQGRRNNIVNPCRHVFACTDCMDDLMEKYKVCLLCSKSINGYEPL